MDRQEEVLIWCRKCSGYARHRLGPKLVNCCRPEQMAREKKQNDENNPDSRRRKSPSETGTELENRGSFEMEGLMAQHGLWNLAMEKIRKERGELLNMEGDAVRE